MLQYNFVFWILTTYLWIFFVLLKLWNVHLILTNVHEKYVIKLNVVQLKQETCTVIDYVK